MTQDPVVLIMNQYAYYGKGSTAYSFRQLSHFGHDTDDQFSAIPGHIQHMVLPISGQEASEKLLCVYIWDPKKW